MLLADKKDKIMMLLLKLKFYHHCTNTIVTIS